MVVQLLFSGVVPCLLYTQSIVRTKLKLCMSSETSQRIDAPLTD